MLLEWSAKHDKIFHEQGRISGPGPARRAGTHKGHAYCILSKLKAFHQQRLAELYTLFTIKDQIAIDPWLWRYCLDAMTHWTTFTACQKRPFTCNVSLFMTCQWKCGVQNQDTLRVFTIDHRRPLTHRPDAGATLTLYNLTWNWVSHWLFNPYTPFCLSLCSVRLSTRRAGFGNPKLRERSEKIYEDCAE